jgi:hypothetical protein
MLKKQTLFFSTFLQRMIENDKKMATSDALRNAIRLPCTMLTHLMWPRCEKDYDGPERFKKYLCGYWGEGDQLREAFKKATRMETLLENSMDEEPHGIEITISLFAQGREKAHHVLTTWICDDGFYGGISINAYTLTV